MGGDDHPLDLVGPLIDRGDLGVAVHALHIHALEVAGAAVDLQGVVGHLQRDIGGVLLGHGGLHAVGLVALLQVGGGIDQQPGATELGGHVGQLKGDRLLEANGFSELYPLLGVLHCGLVSPLGDAQRLGRNADPPAVQGGHGDLEAVALPAQQVFLGHLYIVEDQLRRSGGPDSHFIIMIAKFKALPAFFHNKS